MLFRSLLAALAVAVVVTDSEAGPFRRRARTTYQPVYRPVYPSPSYTPGFMPTVMPMSTPAATPAAVLPAAAAVTGTTTTATAPASTPATVVQASATVPANAAEGDGLDEVNALRAARGLRPYVRDEGLFQAAKACAAFRAANLLFGHTANDFSFVPAGSWASSAGCAAYPASYGWMSCCVYEGHTYAGAAWVTGRDGKRYMHLFVR